MSATSTTTPFPMPKEWPPELAELYTPVRSLGRGGFAFVVLARDKKDNKTLVAIKVVGQNKDKTRREQLTYAHREIDILKELSHPNIMKVVQSWDVPDQPPEQAGSTTSSTSRSPFHNTVCLMALQYYRGPTVESLLQYGGALSNTFGRVVIAQVMDAVAYLHYRCVVHRDIKPDNVIVTGAVSKDDEIWDNPTASEDEEPSAEKQEIDEGEKWKKLCQRWKVTLVDFGFARALTPKDVKKPSLEILRENLGASYHLKRMESDHMNKSKRGFEDSSSRGRRRRSIFARSETTDSNHSYSHLLVRQMSALGNRNFAAPEIINKVKHDEKRGKKGKKNDESTVEITETISEYVADYGLMVDSYSMGHTIRYMMTGVPPYMSITEAMDQQNSICNMLCGGKKNTSRRSVNYRRLDELPKEVVRLIDHLTERSEAKRLSIRKARRSYPWISDVLSGCEHDSEEQRHSLSEISYLPLALKEDKVETADGDKETKIDEKQ